ncbi:hypothetical protein AAC387_Pa01g1691 [Persea americana]
MEDETDDLVSNGIVVVEGGEGIEEWRDEEMAVEGAEVVEEERVWDGLGELREGVGDEVGEAEEAEDWWRKSNAPCSEEEAMDAAGMGLAVWDLGDDSDEATNGVGFWPFWG